MTTEPGSTATAASGAGSSGVGSSGVGSSGVGSSGAGSSGAGLSGVGSSGVGSSGAGSSGAGSSGAGLSGAGSRTRRIYAMTIWAALFVAGCFLLGVPTDPVYLFGWLWAATIAWNSDQPWRTHLRFLRDWAAIVVLLVVYNLTRGYADNGVVAHVHPLIDADVSMWGWAAGGETPTVWLQQHLYNHAHVQWYDGLASLVYFSHFVTVPGIALVLWMRRRAWWWQFMRRWVALFAAGLVTYFIYPAAPPWLAANEHLIPAVARISTRGWQVIGLHGAGNLLNAAQLDAANPVAAMPSLHTGFTVLAVGFFIPRVRARWWPLLVCYPLAMVFTLVYSGEHWVIDAIVGAAYAIAVLLLMSAVERWLARRAAGPPPTGPPPTGPPPRGPLPTGPLPTGPPRPGSPGGG